MHFHSVVSAMWLTTTLALFWLCLHTVLSVLILSLHVCGFPPPVLRSSSCAANVKIPAVLEAPFWLTHETTICTSHPSWFPFTVCMPYLWIAQVLPSSLSCLHLPLGTISLTCTKSFIGILTTFSDSAELCRGVTLHLWQQCTQLKTAQTLNLFVSMPGLHRGWYITQRLLIVSCVDSSTYRSNSDMCIGVQHSFIKNNCSACKCSRTQLWQQSHLCADCVSLQTGLPQLWQTSRVFPAYATASVIKIWGPLVRFIYAFLRENYICH